MGKQKVNKCLYFVTVLLTFVIYLHVKNEEETSLKGAYSSSKMKKDLTTIKSITKSLSEIKSATPTLDQHVIFFNRVPKTGSEMLVLLIQWLQGRNGFKHIRISGGKNRRLNRAQQADIVEEVTSRLHDEAIPLSFDRHVYFINFTSHGRQSPTFINLIRDPVQKLISRFYYSRIRPNPKNPDLKYINLPTPKSVKAIKDFEECVRIQSPECRFENGKFYDLSIPYFCGHNKWCMSLNDEWALEEAKYNVEKYFPVVGVLEELNATLTVLEKKIPYFFSGIRETYFKQLEEPHLNKNKNKPNRIKESLKTKMAEKLKLEYEFYFWLKHRLLKQYHSYN